MAPRITCDCGVCAKCKRRVYMHDYYVRNRERVLGIAKASRLRNIEKVLAYDRERGGTPERQAARRASAANQTKAQKEEARRKRRAWKKRNPHKIRARKQLEYHVSVGNITREPCEVCGAPETEGHHEDYSKPLAVRWLCRKHHMELHRKVAA